MERGKQFQSWIFWRTRRNVFSLKQELDNGFWFLKILWKELAKLISLQRIFYFRANVIYVHNHQIHFFLLLFLMNKNCQNLPFSNIYERGLFTFQVKFYANFNFFVTFIFLGKQHENFMNHTRRMSLCQKVIKSFKCEFNEGLLKFQSVLKFRHF